MANKNKSKNPNAGARRNSQGSPGYLRVFADIIGQIVDRFGWPGAFLVMMFFFVQYNATSEQKQKIVEKFVLGKDLDSVYPMLCVVGVGTCIFFGQNFYWSKRVAILNAEIDRMSKLKSLNQETAIGENLHHTSS